MSLLYDQISHNFIIKVEFDLILLYLTIYYNLTYLKHLH